MKKALIFLGVILGLGQKLSYAMETPKMIPGAAYYQNKRAKIAEYLFLSGFHGTMLKAPRVIFYNAQNEKLKKIEYESGEFAQKQAIFDRMIDQKIQQEKPVSVEIGFDPKNGKKALFYYDKNGQLMNLHSRCSKKIDKTVGNSTYYYKDEWEENKELSSDDYNGPVNIKKAERYPYIVKPHSMLSELKMVIEKDYIFSPSFFTYPKRKIIYKNDGTLTDSITMHHIVITMTKVALGFGAVYAASHWLS